MNNTNPIPARWTTHTLENKYQKKFSQCCEGFKPLLGFHPGDLARIPRNRDSDLNGQLVLIAGILQN